MEIKIDSEQLKSAIHEALLLAIPAEARDLMVRQAIENLVTPKKSGYLSKPDKSEIQEIYEDAIERSIREMVADDIKNDPSIKEDILKVIEPYRYEDYDRQRVIMAALLDALLDYHSKN